MDALKVQTLHALETVISDAEDLINVTIKQDVSKEILEITNNLGQHTTMNCRMNSIDATIRQVCNHINRRNLFSYEPNYIIGM